MSGEDYLLSLLHKKPELFHTESNYINQRPCPFLEYSKDRLTIKYLGKGLLYSDITSVQSVKPANYDTLIYYFEVKINNIGERGDISIGLADADFPLNKHPGWTKRSYGYKADGKVYNNKQVGSKVLPKFTTGNRVGCGINYFKKEIFYTLNGEYQGAVFKDVDLREYYATISLHSLNESVTFNFGNKPFKFDVKKLVLDEKRESAKTILKQPINHYSLHQIVHSYLNFHGYANTLEVFEKTAQIERKDVGLPRREVFEDTNEVEDYKMEEDIQDGETLGSGVKRKKTAGQEMEIETKKVSSTIENKDHDHNKGDDHHHVEILDKEGRYRSESLRLEFESPIFTVTREQFPTDMEPFKLNSDNSNSNSRDFMLLRKASLYPDQNHSAMSTEPVTINLNQGQTNGVQNSFEEKANTYLLYERANLRQLLLEGKISEALEYVSKVFPGLLQENEELLKILHSQQFTEYIREKDHQKAIVFAQKCLTPYQRENIYCLDNQGIVKEVPIDNMMALLCYPEPEKSELKNFLSFEQRDLTADIINKGILSKMGFIDKSILDILIAQLTQTETAYRENSAHSGEVFRFEV